LQISLCLRVTPIKSRNAIIIGHILLSYKLQMFRCSLRQFCSLKNILINSHSTYKLPSINTQHNINYNLFVTSIRMDSNDKPKKSKIYTKTGDKERRKKDDLVFEALGSTDELNAVIGIAHEYCEQLASKLEENRLTEKQGENLSIKDIIVNLEKIQSHLLDVGTHIATPLTKEISAEKSKQAEFDEQNISLLENWIDALDSKLPPLRNFILPSGGLSSAHLHLARTVCRRAERNIVTIVNEGQADIVVQKYMNRLSDFLFVAARFVAKQEGKQEMVYQKGVGTIKK